MDSGFGSFFARIDSEISEGRFYESMQHIMTLSKRLDMKKRYRESLDMLYKYALVYLEHGQFVLAGELMDEYSKVAESGSVKFEPESIERLVAVFEAPWKNSREAATFMQSREYASTMALFTKFMNRAILWSKSDEFPSGQPELHRALGAFYKHDGQLAKAQANLVLSQDVELLLEVVNEWVKQAESQNPEFFHLRALLMLLAANDVSSAKCFVCLLNYDFEDVNTPIPIQFGYLLSECCDPPNFELFKEVCETYKEVIAKDKEYGGLVETIKGNYFNGTNFNFSGQGGLENSLSSFIQALM